MNNQQSQNTSSINGRGHAVRRQRRRLRIQLLLAAVVVLAVGIGLALYGLKNTITYFYGPSQVVGGEVAFGQKFRLGGLVEAGTIAHENASAHKITFNVTDGVKSVKVAYEGLLPDLFREGQGVVVNGALGTDGVMQASEILAKHDENYMPKEAVEAMKRAGTWKGK